MGGWGNRELNKDTDNTPLSPNKETSNWGSPNDESRRGWGSSGPKDKICGWGISDPNRPSTSRGDSNSGSSSFMKYPAVNFGRFPSRLCKYFGNADRSSSLAKRSRVGDFSLTD